MSVRIAAERIEGGCDYDVSPDWETLPIVLSTSTFIETVDENAETELTTLDELVGNRFITRGHESIAFTTGSDAVEYPLVDNSFQIVNNFAGMLPETSIERYRAGKKRRVFSQGGYKVLVVEGIRPITKDAPGIDRGEDALADMLDRYDLTVSDWEDLYASSIDRLGVRMTALRAGVTDRDVHADRTVYGIRTRDEELAYHISGVFNSLLYTVLQISWFGRIRFTANDVVSNVRLTSLTSAPVPERDEELADIQREIEETVRDVETPIEDRIERLQGLQCEREWRVCELYGVTEDDGEAMKALLQEARTWQTFVERILNLTEEETSLETNRLNDF